MYEFNVTVMYYRHGLYQLQISNIIIRHSNADLQNEKLFFRKDAAINITRFKMKNSTTFTLHFESEI